MSKTHTIVNNGLNFTENISKLSMVDILPKLNYVNLNNGLSMVDILPKLNFDVADYDGIYIIYKVLIDFIENYSVGDVFLKSEVVDFIVDYYG